MELEIFEAKYTELEKYLFHPWIYLDANALPKLEIL